MAQFAQVPDVIVGESTLDGGQPKQVIAKPAKLSVLETEPDRGTKGLAGLVSDPVPGAHLSRRTFEGTTIASDPRSVKPNQCQATVQGGQHFPSDPSG